MRVILARAIGVRLADGMGASGLTELVLRVQCDAGLVRWLA